MATYKGIQGYTVQKLSSDPTAAEAVGQLWYNSASGAFKIGTQGAGAWSSGGTMSTARDLLVGGGTQGAAIFVMGEPPVSGGAGVAVENYNGSAWTTGTSLGTYRYGGGGSGGPGSQTNFLVFGGSQSAPGMNNTELWNGSSWTEKNDLNQVRNYTTGSSQGSVTAALCFGGGGPPGILDQSETWNGTSWAEGNDLNTARQLDSGGGTSTAAICAGGSFGPPGTTANTETYNGTSWTEVNNLNTARGGIFNGLAGGQTAAIAAGGETPTKVANTESWDGTSWTEVADLAASKSKAGGAGISTAALIGGGSLGSGGYGSASEEWNDPVYAIKTVTVS